MRPFGALENGVIHIPIDVNLDVLGTCNPMGDMSLEGAVPWKILQQHDSCTRVALALCSSLISQSRILIPSPNYSLIRHMGILRFLWNAYKSHPDPEDEAEYRSSVPAPSSFVPWVFMEDIYVCSVPGILKLFKVVDNGPEGSNRLEELSSCRVTEVEHYRRGGGLKVHEYIVLEIRHDKDVRYVKFGRERRDLRDRRNYQEFQRSSFHEALKQIAGGTASSQDKYTVLAAKNDLVLKGSVLVQSFHPPASANLHILDCVILAHTLHCSALNYSSLHHMCIWWAGMFFISVLRLSQSTSGGELLSTRGPAFTQRGTFDNIQLVNAKGELCLRSPDIVPKFLARMEKLLGWGDTAKTDMATVRKLVEGDVDLERKAGLVPDEIWSLFQQDRAEVHEDIKKRTAVRDAERARVAQQDVLLARQDGLLAQVYVTLAQQDVTLAQQDVAQAQKYVENVAHAQQDVVLVQEYVALAQKDVTLVQQYVALAQKYDVIAQHDVALACIQDATASTQAQIIAIEKQLAEQGGSFNSTLP